MKRFRFRLETVLRARRLVADVARRDLVVASTERRRREDELSALGAELDTAVEQLAELQGSDSIDPTPVLVAAGAVDRVCDLIEGATGRLKEATETEERAREVFAAARRDVRAVEDLREKAVREHREACAREELAELEELGLWRHVRPVRPGGDS